MKRRKGNLLDDANDDSDNGSQSPDSDNAVNNSRTAVKKKFTARKRGIAPGRQKKKVQKLQDGSDGGASTRPNTPQNATDEESANEDKSDSDTVTNVSTTNKTKATARKRGRPPKTTNKKVQRSQDDSDDGASTRPNTPQIATDEESDSDCTTNNSVTNKTKATARKRGRPPKSTNKKVPRLQDDSDDGESTRPNSPVNANDDSDNSSDSDFNAFLNKQKKKVADSANTSKRQLGRPSLAFINKKQGLQNGTLRAPSPQPSTSQNGIYHSESESDSDTSTSEDSDCGPINERSKAKKKARRPARKTNARAVKKNLNYSNSIKAGSSSVNSAQLNAQKKINAVKSSVNSSHLNESQRKGSKVSQSQDASMDSKLVENLAQKLVYFLLIEDQKKYAIRRKGIVTHVFKNSEYSPKLYTAVIKKANIFLKKIYGMELMELENQKDSYLIVNLLRQELGVHDYIDIPRIKQQQHALISFLLTVIYMNENVITEDELTRCLKPLGIDLTSKRMHPVFGDVKKYITTELVKQMYLNYECISKEPPKYEFTWGLRAKQEFDKLDLLQFVCRIMDDTEPADWRMQFRDAEASAKPNGNS